MKRKVNYFGVKLLALLGVLIIVVGMSFQDNLLLLQNAFGETEELENQLAFVEIDQKLSENSSTVVEESTTKVSHIPDNLVRQDLEVNIIQSDDGVVFLEPDISLASMAAVDTSWAWPTNPNYYISNRYSSGHRAIDIAGSGYNSTIYSAGGGTVVTNGRKQNNGNYIVIKQDNGYYVMYAHLATSTVTVGQRVEKGQAIGGMGRTGTATGVHLDFSVWQYGYPYGGGRAVNPLNFY